MINIHALLSDPDSFVIRMRNNRNEQQLSPEDVAGCGQNFNVVDVETANRDRSTICQIGIAHIVDGQVVDRWCTLIDPEDEFDDWNIKIHGITQADVQGAPTMPEVREELRQRLRGQILVSHTPYDRGAFEMAMDKYDLEQLQVYWLDSAKIARRAWPEKFGQRGYGLKNVSYYIGHEFKHHDALEDAIAAAEITLAACREHNVDVEYWLHLFEGEIAQKKRQKHRSYSAASIPIECNTEGELYGEVIVFTGELQIPRNIAKSYAAFMGCEIKSAVTRKTTILVSGSQVSPLITSSSGKSNKHVKAEERILQGQEIKIISETDFLSLIANHQPPVPLQTLSAEKEERERP